MTDFISEPKNPPLKSFYDAEMLAKDIASMIYRQGKAQIFNILESQYENPTDFRLIASKRMAENVLTNIGRDAKMLIRDILDDWKIEVGIDPESVLTGSEEEEARKEYQEDEKRFG